MDTNQAKGKTGGVKGKIKEFAGKMTGDKNTEQKGRAEKDGSKTGAKVGDMNGEAKIKRK